MKVSILLFLIFAFAHFADAQSLAERSAARANSKPLPTFVRPAPDNPAANPDWRPYVQAINTYQRAYPGIYTPLDLIRWDKLPKDWLSNHVRRHARIWQNSEQQVLSADDKRLQRIVLSRNANQELFSKIQELTKGQERFLWMGSTRSFLDSIPPDDRISITPLDEVFVTSELGKEIFERVHQQRSAPITGFFVDTQNKQIILETKSSTRSPASVDDSFFKVEFIENNARQLQVRTFYRNNERLGADIAQASENFRGALLNSRSNEKLPFGPMPRQDQVRFDEGGVQHIGGAGHEGCLHP